MRYGISIIIGTALYAMTSWAAAQPDSNCSEQEQLNGYESFIFLLEDDDRARLNSYCALYQGIKAKDPEGVNKALDALIRSTNGRAFLKDVDFKIKTFDIENGGSVLGFSYDYTKTNKASDYHYSVEKNLTTGVAWTFSAKGNVAFDDQANPADFLDTRFSITGFRDYGGVSNARDASAALLNYLADLEDRMANIEDPDELQAYSRRFKDAVSGFFTTQTYLGFDVNVGLESNQRFTQKQWTYGGTLSLDIKGYGKSNTVGAWNILDYPFALLRSFSGFGDSTEIRPLGYSFPTFVIGVDQVDPENNEARKALGETDKFERFRAEIYFRTPIARVGESDVFANMDYRYWRELSPSDAIQTADLDTFDYLTFSISASSGVYVSYSRGMLPFDLADTKVYELGWKFNFQ